MPPRVFRGGQLCWTLKAIVWLTMDHSGAVPLSPGQPIFRSFYKHHSTSSVKGKGWEYLNLKILTAYNDLYTKAVKQTFFGHKHRKRWEH
jgi:hypothetical protein